ncbi:MAG: aldo/keto reductase [Planctomycetota bacterium]|nr:aldo/keto reductase [Planctomycetota bacterium]
MTTTYTPAATRYDNDSFFRRCGRSGLMLPAISLGMWHNFGDAAKLDNCREICFTAFDLGVTHFDLANNYGPPPGSAETNTGKILREMPRDELIISTKAGWRMWPGPYGDLGSRKYLLASLDQSLKRLGLDYVDIFYHHRPDLGTPIDETMAALDQAVRSGKALYAGISSYSGEQTATAAQVCADKNLTPLLIHQPYYNMLGRGIEADLLPETTRLGMGVIAFCPLAQGMLTDRYFNGIPTDSRAGSATGFLKKGNVTPEALAKPRRLAEIAKQRGQSLAQMAIAWVLRNPAVTSALIGASSAKQVRENVDALKKPTFTAAELAAIDAALKD